MCKMLFVVLSSFQLLAPFLQKRSLNSESCHNFYEKRLLEIGMYKMLLPLLKVHVTIVTASFFCCYYIMMTT